MFARSGRLIRLRAFLWTDANVFSGIDSPPYVDDPEVVAVDIADDYARGERAGPSRILVWV
jgi:hypothetical protein